MLDASRPGIAIVMRPWTLTARDVRVVGPVGHVCGRALILLGAI